MMIDYLAGHAEVSRSSRALYQDDEYGKSFLTAFEKDLGRFGLKLTAAESVKRGVTDVSAQIAKLQAAQARGDLPRAGAGAGRAGAEGAPEDRLDRHPHGLHRSAHRRALPGARRRRRRGRRGVVAVARSGDLRPARASGSTGRTCRSTFRRTSRTGTRSRATSPGMLFTEAAKRAGRNLTRESLITALESIKGFESGILPPLTIGPDHETQKQGFWVTRRERTLQAADGLAQVRVGAVLAVDDLSISFGGLDRAERARLRGRGAARSSR